MSRQGATTGRVMSQPAPGDDKQATPGPHRRTTHLPTNRAQAMNETLAVIAEETPHGVMTARVAHILADAVGRCRAR